MNCLVCKQTNTNITDIRGQSNFENRLRNLLFQENEEIPDSGPLHCCIECLAHMVNLESRSPETLSVPHLLRNMDSVPQNFAPQPLPSPDSSGRLALSDSNDSSSASSEATMSENIATAAAVAPTNQSLSQPTTDDDIVMGPPADPRLFAEWKRIMNKPGPRSLKRRRILQLHNNNVPEPEIASQPEPAFQPSPVRPSDRPLLNRLITGAHDRKRQRREEKRASQSQNSTTSSQGSDSSRSLNIISRSQSPAFVAGVLPTAVVSPLSSQLTSQSPSTLISQDRRRLPSSSLSSSEELLTRSLRAALSTKTAKKPNPPPPNPQPNPRPTKTRVATPPPPNPQPNPRPTTTRVATPPLSSSPDPPAVPVRPAPPAAPVRQEPPKRIFVTKRTDDGNAHSNGGAPRRINTVRPNGGANARSTRPDDPKYTSGG